MRRVVALALALLLGLPATARASSVPPVDLAPGHGAVEFGLDDFNFDHMLGDRLSLGLSVSAFQDAFALRNSYRLTTGSDTTWGLTLGVGLTPVTYDLATIWSYAYSSAGPPSYWLAPGVVWVWHDKEQHLTWRGSLSPSLYLYPDNRNHGLIYRVGMNVSPSLELAFGEPGGFEVVWGGNALVGLRYGL